MDPSIMKLLEEDEDETMHSGVDVEAFTAALNRDIEGDASSLQPSGPDPAVVSQGNPHTSCLLHSLWQTSSLDGMASSQNQQELKIMQQQEPPSAENYAAARTELVPNQLDAEDQQPQAIDTLQQPDHLLNRNESQDNLKKHHTEQRLIQFPRSTVMQVPNIHSEQMAIQLSRPIVTHISENESVQSALTMNQKTQDGDQQRKEPSTLQFRQVKGVKTAERNPIFNSESQYSILGMNKDMATPLKQAGNPVISGKQVPFAMLLPEIVSQLDKDRAMQLQTLYAKLKKNEIAKDGFVRHMKALVGDQRLKLAVLKLQSQASAQTHPLKMVASNSPQHLHGSHSFSQLHQKENGSQTSQEMEQRSNSQVASISQKSSSGSNTINQERELSTSSIQGLTRQQQQQHFHFPETSFPTYHSYPGTNVRAPASSPMPQSLDSQLGHVPLHQSKGRSLLGGSTQVMNAVGLPKLEQQNSINDTRRSQVGSLSKFSSSAALTSTECGNAVFYVKEESAEQNYEQHQMTQLPAAQGVSSFPVVQSEQEIEHASLEKQSSKMVFLTSTNMSLSNSVSSSLPMQMDHNAVFNPQITPTTSPAGSNVKTPPKKVSNNQKKPVEALYPPPPLSNKKQKVSGGLADQSIEQLNDVTAVSGVNLREEEEQMFSGTKDESRVSELSRKVAKEEEEKLFLQRIPLQKKLASIMKKCGISNIDNDVERCLSLCAEERLRGLVGHLIRLSKQRVNHEKWRHRTFVNSDVRQQITLINQKAREEYEKKHAKEDECRRPHDSDGNFGLDGDDKEKDDGRSKSVKLPKEDEKMRATAANVAARAAAGGDDMLSKWQLMAEQARQKREGGSGSASGSHSGREGSSRPYFSGSDGQEAPAAPAPGRVRGPGRNEVSMAQAQAGGGVSVKDVIAVLEREPQMSKSSLIYGLYQKVHAGAAAD